MASITKIAPGGGPWSYQTKGEKLCVSAKKIQQKRSTRKWENYPTYGKVRAQ